MVSRKVVPAALRSSTTAHRASRDVGVEPGRRLVEEDQFGRAPDRHREVDAPLLPAGQLRDAGGAFPGHADPIQHRVDVVAPSRDRAGQRDALPHGELGGEAGVLEHDAHARPDVAAVGRVAAQHA